MNEEHILDAQGDDLRPCEERNREEGEEDIDHGKDKRTLHGIVDTWQMDP